MLFFNKRAKPIKKKIFQLVTVNTLLHPNVVRYFCITNMAFICKK